jgi:hypothetical protein
MLFEPETKIIGYADIQGAVPTACEDVDVVKHVVVRPAERRSNVT